MEVTCCHSNTTSAAKASWHKWQCPLLKEARWSTGENPKPRPLWLPRIQFSRRNWVPSFCPHLLVECWVRPLPQFITATSAGLPKFLFGTRNVAASDLYIRQDARLYESQAGIKIAGRNSHNLRCADGSTLTTERQKLKRNWITPWWGWKRRVKKLV